MNIVKQKWIFLNSTLAIVPKQIRKLYCFGAKTLVLRKIDGLRANARLLQLNCFTAKSKIYRLMNNAKFIVLFIKLMMELRIVRPKDILAVDFSDFGNSLQVLMFAKQTCRGRTVPVYFEVLRYPIKRGSQNIFIIEAIKNLKNHLGFMPRLVFDRGFACPHIIKFLAENGYIFYIRVKKGKGLIDWWSKRKFIAENSKQPDLTVSAYGQKLRLIISDKAEDADEPWHIITNDFRSSRRKIIKIYYHRFEIEEFFRDAKRLLGLEQVNFKTEQSLSIALWFVILGIWFLWSIEEKEEDKLERNRSQLSIIRYYLEKIHSQIISLAEGKFMSEFLPNSS